MPLFIKIKMSSFKPLKVMLLKVTKTSFITYIEFEILQLDHVHTYKIIYQ